MDLRKTISSLALAATVLALALPAAGAPAARGGEAAAGAWSWLAGAWDAAVNEVGRILGAEELSPIPDPNGLDGPGGELDPGTDLSPIPDPNG